jgi:purine-binding chemotaxis protein CheW
MSEQRVATFWAGNLLLAVAVDRVQEVLRSQRIMPVPLAPRYIRGLFNLRGQVVTAVDVRCRLGQPEREPDEGIVNFIILTEGGLMSLVVDREDDVVDLDGCPFEVPQTVDPGIRSLVTGVHKLNGALLLLIDVDRLLSPVAG